MKNRPYDVGPGWWPMLDEMLAKAKEVDPAVKHEEKEKYGRCDMYFETELENLGDALYNIQDAIEEQSQQICEYCGQPGHPRDDGWIKTLCDRCHGLDLRDRYKVAEETAERYFRATSEEYGCGTPPGR